MARSIWPRPSLWGEGSCETRLVEGSGFPSIHHIGNEGRGFARDEE